MNRNYREELLTKVIRKFGMEHSATITFACLMENENVSDTTLAYLAEMNPICEDGDEED